MGNRVELAMAAKRGDAVSVGELLAKGASPDSDDRGEAGSGHRTALMWAVLAQSPDCVRHLINAGADLELGVPDGGAPPLVQAASMESSACLEVLLGAGANPNVKNKHAVSALRVAAHYGKPKAIRLLLAKGAHVDDTDGSGVTSAMAAAAEGHVDCLVELIRAGANIEAFDVDGETAMDRAIRRHEIECVALLEAAMLGDCLGKAKGAGPKNRI